MNNSGHRQFGMTLVEMLVTLAVVLILISASARLGRFVITRSSVRLTQSALEVLDTALQLYYDDYGVFPPQVDSKVDFENVLGFPVEISSGVMPESGDYWRAAALFYFLDRNPDSRSVVDALTASLITNKDDAGTTLLIKIPAGGDERDFVRFIDPWGNTLRYEYTLGDVFPRIISAGPDGKFETVEDNIENQ